MGHVLIDFDWSQVCDGFCKRAGVGIDSFGPVLKHLGSLGYETGKVNTALFLSELNRVLNCAIEEPEFTSLWNATFVENLEMVEILTSLKSQFKLYLLSNTNENHYSWIQQNYDVSRHFDELILSYEIGHAKPDLAIYSEVMSRSGLEPAQCLFVDDLEDNIAAARSVGMKAVLFTSPDALRRELVNYGVDLNKLGSGR